MISIKLYQIQKTSAVEKRTDLAFRYSLPELSDWRSEVGSVHSPPEGLVLAECILDTVLCVPRVIAAGPRELRLKALEQVVQTPGQDHDVVDVQQGNDHNGSIADTCIAKKTKNKKHQQLPQIQQQHTDGGRRWMFLEIGRRLFVKKKGLNRLFHSLCSKSCQLHKCRRTVQLLQVNR